MAIHHKIVEKSVSKYQSKKLIELQGGTESFKSPPPENKTKQKSTIAGGKDIETFQQDKMRMTKLNRNKIWP